MLSIGGDVGLTKVIDDTGDETSQHVYQKLMRGEQQLWVVAEGQQFVGTAITQIETREITRVLNVRYIAGKGFAKWAFNLHQEFTAFAREAKCNGIEASGRPGLWSVLRELGWIKNNITYWTEV